MRLPLGGDFLSKGIGFGDLKIGLIVDLSKNLARVKIYEYLIKRKNLVIIEKI